MQLVVKVFLLRKGRTRSLILLRWTLTFWNTATIISPDALGIRQLKAVHCSGEGARELNACLEYLGVLGGLVLFHPVGFVIIIKEEK